MLERLGNRLNPTEKIEVGVIGGGVIGLSIARTLAGEGREVIVFEAENEHGMHASSRNSEVIHSGIYYEPGSLKASLSVSGRKSLYEYCSENEVLSRQLGKIIVVGRDKDIPKLEQLKAQGEANGVDDLVFLDSYQVAELEPAIKCVAGLLSPSSGILDSHRYMALLKRDITRSKSWVLVSSPVLNGEVQNNGIALSIGGNNPVTVLCSSVINSAGFSSQDVAGSIDGLPKSSIPDRFLAKGHYFTLKGKSPFSHLVYPLPVPGGLGIHVTLDMDNRAKFGPDVSWINEIDYSFDESRVASFYEAIKEYYPALKEGELQPGYTGIRSKLAPMGSPDQDFMIQGTGDHGIPGLINLYGIESPGLTASLAIAEYVSVVLKGENK